MRYYLIGFDNEGLTQLGTNWQQSTWLTSEKSHKEHSDRMKQANKNIKVIYVLPENKYTQTMCEMNTYDFGEAVKQKSIYSF